MRSSSEPAANRHLSSSETRSCIYQEIVHYYIDTDISPYLSIPDISPRDNDPIFAGVHHCLSESSLSEAVFGAEQNTEAECSFIRDSVPCIY